MRSISRLLDWNSNIVVDSKTGEPLNGKEIAERTNLSKNIVSMGLRELQSKGIIYITGATKNSRQYVVNPSVAWKGNRVAKDIAQVRHFNKHGLKLPVNINTLKDQYCSCSGDVSPCETHCL